MRQWKYLGWVVEHSCFIFFQTGAPGISPALRFPLGLASDVPASGGRKEGEERQADWSLIEFPLQSCHKSSMWECRELRVPDKHVIQYYLDNVAHSVGDQFIVKESHSWSPLGRQLGKHDDDHTCTQQNWDKGLIVDCHSMLTRH